MKRGHGIRRAALTAMAACALAACDPGGVLVSPAPAPRPDVPDGPPEPSATSRALEVFYRGVQQTYLVQGLLRQDGGGPDTPFTTRQLIENFVRVALYEEFTMMNGRLVAKERSSRLHRWEEPVRMSVRFGATVPEAKRDRDRRSINAYAGRLARLTGQSVTVSETNPNFYVFVVNEDERAVIGTQLREIMPDISSSAVAAVEGMRRSTLCLVFARYPGNDGVYTQAVAIIRAEHPDLLRLSCIHEELAQGMGLANDSPAARPSVFNDDEEFALLTEQDELMLRMLYDPRLRPGMTEDEARPIIEIIAAELRGGES